MAVGTPGTWWGRAWLDALERAGGSYESRLPRGRTFARRGQVQEIEINPGHVRGRVVGRHGELHRVDIAVRQLAGSEWDQLAGAIASRAAHLAALLDGELDPGIVGDAQELDVALLPAASDLRPDCDCPDWAEPCPHAAAVCYVVADELDRDPFVLFTLRGRTRQELMDAVRAARSGSPVEDSDPADGVGHRATPSDPPGVDATTAWADRRPGDELGPLPSPAPGSAAHLGAGATLPPPWDPELPRHAGVEPRRVDALAEDAARRAASMLIDGAGSGLGDPPVVDVARRAAASPDDAADLASRAGLTAGHLRALAAAWDLAGAEGVRVVATPDSWLTDQDVLSAGRDRLVDQGLDRRSIALNYDSLRMQATTWFVVGPDRRWYRLRGATKHDGLHLEAGPCDDPVDLLDERSAPQG